VVVDESQTKLLNIFINEIATDNQGKRATRILVTPEVASQKCKQGRLGERAPIWNKRYRYL
jgi:hypothetical protein